MGLNVLMVQYPRTVTISTTGKDKGKRSDEDGHDEAAPKSTGPAGKARAALDAITGRRDSDGGAGEDGKHGSTPAEMSDGEQDDSFEVIVEVADEVANVQQGERRKHTRSGQAHMSATESDRLRSGQPSGAQPSALHRTADKSEKVALATVADELFDTAASGDAQHADGGGNQGAGSSDTAQTQEHHAAAAPAGEEHIGSVSAESQQRSVQGGGEATSHSGAQNSIAQSSFPESVLIHEGDTQPGSTDPAVSSSRNSALPQQGSGAHRGGEGSSAPPHSSPTRGPSPAPQRDSSLTTERPTQTGSVVSLEDVRSKPYYHNMSDEVLSEPDHAAEQPMTDKPGEGDHGCVAHGAQATDSTGVVRTAYHARSEAEEISLDENPRLRSDDAPSDWDDEDADADKPHQTAQEAHHKSKASQQQYDAQMDLDVDAMVREELKWLKADGYLAGNASFHQSVSGEVIFLTFPTDEAHAAFITTVFEELGIGRDFGSVLVVPVSGGESSYRHLGWNNPEKIEYKRQQLKAKKLGTEATTEQPADGPGLMAGTSQGPGLVGWLRGVRKRMCCSNKADTPARSRHGLKPANDSDDETNGSDEDEDDEERVNQDSERRKARRTRYMSLASKLRVDQVLESIRIDARIDFDYIAFLIISSVLAAVGLATNSAPTIVASMLISPIMGPVLAMAISANVRKPKLFRLGAYNYILTVGICLVVGFIGGLMGTPWLSEENAWPTSEMLSRAFDPIRESPHRAGRTTLLLGIVIGTFSGAGVALSVLSQSSSSLVGVAISAALLPPMVNAGMTWAAAVMQVALKRDWDLDPYQWFQVGGFSLGLALINTVCVAGAAILMFKVKEVAPRANATAFWKEDLRAVRSLRKQQQDETLSLERFMKHRGSDSNETGKKSGRQDRVSKERYSSDESHQKRA